ncbi:hypothetical protein [Pseudomonas helvetica]|uniref:hypothetical protein n=1 Tax=Pseudomonas helvetica TaxID=3136738 RepID=UPI003265A410
MKRIKPILLSGVFLISGCQHTYESFVREEMKIPNVFVPSSDEGHPYSLFMAKKGSNFEQVCSAAMLTGLSEDQIKAKRAVNKTPDYELVSGSAATFDIELKSDDLGGLYANYAMKYGVTLGLTRGRVYSLPDVSISEVLQKINSTTCAADVAVLRDGEKDIKLYIPTHMYSYDVSYRIYSGGAGGAAIDLPPAVKKIILAKLGVKYNDGYDATTYGAGLYVGFRGKAVTENNMKEALVAAASAAKVASAAKTADTVAATTALTAANTAREAADIAASVAPRDLAVRSKAAVAASNNATATAVVAESTAETAAAAAASNAIASAAVAAADIAVANVAESIVMDAPKGSLSSGVVLDVTSIVEATDTQ